MWASRLLRRSFHQHNYAGAIKRPEVHFTLSSSVLDNLLRGASCLLIRSTEGTSSGVRLNGPLNWRLYWSGLGEIRTLVMISAWRQLKT